MSAARRAGSATAGGRAVSSAWSRLVAGSVRAEALTWTPALACARTPGAVTAIGAGAVDVDALLAGALARLAPDPSAAVQAGLVPRPVHRRDLRQLAAGSLAPRRAERASRRGA